MNHHLDSTDIADVPALTDAQRRALRGCIVLCRKVKEGATQVGLSWSNGSAIRRSTSIGVASAYVLERSIVLANTKFEFGRAKASAVVRNSMDRYLEAYRRLTGTALDLERF